MITVFYEIKELLTLSGSAKKCARNIKLDDLSIIKNAAIAVEGEKIIWVGESRKVPKFKKCKKVSLKGKTVLPAFSECHTHSVFSGSRSNEFEMRVQGASYQEIADKGGGIKSTVTATRLTQASVLTEITKTRLQNFLKQGVTTVEIKSGYGLNLESELKILKIISILNKNKTGRLPNLISTYLGPHAVPDNYSSSETYMNEIIHEHLPKIHKLKLSKRADIFIEKGYFSVEQAQAYSNAVKTLGWDLVVHADQLTRQGGAEFAVKNHAVSADHLIQISSGDIQSLAKSDVTCVLLPAADLYLKCAYPPARKLLDAGARCALSTDFNPGSSPTQDISLVGLLARLEMKMTLSEVIVSYTLGAAYALKLQDVLGSLEPKKQADFLILNGDWQDLFYSIGTNCIDSVVHCGKLLKFS